MKFLNLIFIILLTACQKDIPTLNERKSSVLSLAQEKNFEEINIKTSTFTLFSLQNKKIECKNKDLKIYIEGDGLSWISRKTISKDPTPINSTILKLMYEDDSDCKLYLARPCQFVNTDSCNSSYWTNKRFSLEVIKSFDESLDFLKKEYKNSNFILIGHSGGGAVATLVASNRDDIGMIITVAGNLDIQKWTSIYNLSELKGSLNPADFTKQIQNIKQYHLIGNNDKIIPKDIFLSYFSRFEKKEKVHFLYFDEEHNCCWEKHYKKFLNEIED